MSTTAQKFANAQNSRFSTGPRTEEGKQKAAQNSAKHYLTAKQLVVPGEDPEAYTELLEGLEQSWNPVNVQESLLVEQIAQNAWRLMRVRRLEAATFDRWMPSLEPEPAPEPEPKPVGKQPLRLRAPKNHDNAMAVAFEKFNQAFDNVRRYATPIERAYHNAIAELAKLQKQRKVQEIGSVSQKPEKTGAAAGNSHSIRPAITQESPIVSTEPLEPQASPATPLEKE